MNTEGLPMTTESPASRPSAATERNLPRRNLALARSASRSATMNPALCRFPA
jgi:hypothetical protein